MLLRLWVLAAAFAALAVCGAACSLMDEADMDLANRLSGASAAARSGGFSTLLDDDVRLSLVEELSLLLAALLLQQLQPGCADVTQVPHLQLLCLLGVLRQHAPCS